MPLPPVTETALQSFDTANDAWSVVEAMSTALESQFEQMASIDGLLGGRAPYDDDELRANGHAEMMNLNLRGARMRVRRAFRRSLDLLISTPQAIRVRFRKWDEPSTRELAQDHLADCLTKFLRSPKAMRARRHRLRESIRFGAGFAYFVDAMTPKPRFLPRASVLLPVDAKDDPAEWTVAAVHDELTPLALLRILDSGDPAWDRQALLLAAWLASAEDKMADERAFNEEKAVATERKLRLNAVGSSYGTGAIRVPISRVYARNAAGKVDEFTVYRASGHSKFLCRRTDYSDCFSKLLYPLYYTEEPHLYWDIEGLGHDIYNAEMLRDRSINATVDYMDLSLRPVVKWANGNKRATPPRVDRFIHVDVGDELNFEAARVDISAPLGISTFLDRNLDSASAGTQSTSSEGSRQPISAAEARTQDIQSDEQQTVAADFLYEGEEVLVREMCNRLLDWEESEVDPDGEADDFRKKIRGYDYFQAKFFKPENVEITLYRAVGAGSGRDRRLALGTLFQARGALDPTGARRLTRDFVKELAGPDYADRYAPLVDERNTPTVGGQHAHLENAVFRSGQSLPVPVDDNHGLHAPIHLGFLIEVVKSGMQAEEQQAQFDSRGMLATLGAGLPHAAQHIDFFVAGAATAELKAQGDQFVSALSQVTNYMQRLQKRVRDEQIAAAKEQERQQIAAMQERAGIQQKMQAMENEIFKLRTDNAAKMAKTRSDMRIAEQDAEQRRALAEIEAERQANARAF